MIAVVGRVRGEGKRHFIVCLAGKNADQREHRRIGDQIRVEIGGRVLTLRADAGRIGFEGDIAYVKPQGTTTLNIRRFVGDGGPVKISATGPANATGILEIYP